MTTPPAPVSPPDTTLSTSPPPNRQPYAVILDNTTSTTTPSASVPPSGCGFPTLSPLSLALSPTPDRTPPLDSPDAPPLRGATTASAKGQASADLFAHIPLPTKIPSPRPSAHKPSVAISAPTALALEAFAQHITRLSADPARPLPASVGNRSGPMTRDTTMAYSTDASADRGSRRTASRDSPATPMEPAHQSSWQLEEVGHKMVGSPFGSPFGSPIGGSGSSSRRTRRVVRFPSADGHSDRADADIQLVPGGHLDQLASAACGTPPQRVATRRAGTSRPTGVLARKESPRRVSNDSASLSTYYDATQPGMAEPGRRRSSDTTVEDEEGQPPTRGPTRRTSLQGWLMHSCSGSEISDPSTTESDSPIFSPMRAHRTSMRTTRQQHKHRLRGRAALRQSVRAGQPARVPSPLMQASLRGCVVVVPATAPSPSPDMQRQPLSWSHRTYDRGSPSVLSTLDLDESYSLLEFNAQMSTCRGSTSLVAQSLGTTSQSAVAAAAFAKEYIAHLAGPTEDGTSRAAQDMTGVPSQWALGGLAGFGFGSPGSSTVDVASVRTGTSLPAMPINEALEGRTAAPSGLVSRSHTWCDDASRPGTLADVATAAGRAYHAVGPEHNPSFTSRPYQFTSPLSPTIDADDNAPLGVSRTVLATVTVPFPVADDNGAPTSPGAPLTGDANASVAPLSLAAELSMVPSTTSDGPLSMRTTTTATQSVFPVFSLSRGNSADTGSVGALSDMGRLASDHLNDAAASFAAFVVPPTLTGGTMSLAESSAFLSTVPKPGPSSRMFAALNANALLPTPALHGFPSVDEAVAGAKRGEEASEWTVENTDPSEEGDATTRLKQYVACSSFTLGVAGDTDDSGSAWD